MADRFQDFKPEWDMTITTLSSREFNQDASRAKKAAKQGPVFITDRGRPAHVLLTIKEYRKITNKQENILDSGDAGCCRSRI